MLPLLTRAAAREADRHAIEGMGVPGVVLMESAGRGAFEVIAREHAASLERVLLVGGPGQNGGDAWVVARHLARVGHTPRALLVVPDGELGHLAGDARINWHVLAPLGIATTVIAPEQQDVLADALRSATLVVDGVFGTGLARDVSGAWAAVLLAMNAALVPKVALDLPSGVDADTGAVLGTAIHATTTITFGAHKRGLVQRPGRTHAGRVWVADIGVPVGRDAPDHVLEAADLRVLVPPRTPRRSQGQRRARGHRGR
ncbi:MAG: NAD(P)H-hydrate epimerase [Sandaracinaceae bacterium]|nr:NAD(P)H-hydrate epimerase [Sandaracinaceae bacterium]